MSNINNYEPSIIAEKIKKERMGQNITIKTMLKEINLSHTAIYRMFADGGAPPYIRAAPATLEPPNLNRARRLT